MGFTYGQITEIAGYHLTDRIGSGGMGDVYKGYNKALQRLAAVKILHQKEMAERFRNEAYIQASVSHPNIACMYEYIVSRGIPCIIMEYVEGENSARIFGVVRESGTYTFKVSVWCYGTNTTGQSGEKEYTLVVK